MAAIEVDGLTKRFGDLVAVDGVSFNVPQGSVFGFLGPNGSGKTTTLGMLTGLIPPDEGTARVHGHDVRTDLPGALARMGALIEEPAFYPHLSGHDNLRLIGRLVGVDADGIRRALERMGLARDQDRKYATYSQGMRRRLGIAAAMLAGPEVLVLDEPTNGLDPAGQQEMQRMLREIAAGGQTVLVSSHALPEVQAMCDHVAILNHGRVIEQGPLGDVLQADGIVEVEVDDVALAGRVLDAMDDIASFEARGDVLLVRTELDSATVNLHLVSQGVGVRALRPRSGLQEHFLELTKEAP